MHQSTAATFHMEGGKHPLLLEARGVNASIKDELLQSYDLVRHVRFM